MMVRLELASLERGAEDQRVPIHCDSRHPGVSGVSIFDRRLSRDIRVCLFSALSAQTSIFSGSTTLCF